MTDITTQSTASWRDYYEMCKPRVVMLMILTSLVGMLLAVPGMVPVDILILGNLGIALVAGSGAVVNHLIDRKIDVVMKRTHNRPIPQGRGDPLQAGIFAAVIGLAGILRPIDQPGYAPHDYQRLTPALEHALKQCRKTVSVPAMAKRAGLSTSQLQREFRRLFRMSPSEYVMRLRLQLARRQLTESNDAVGTIAQACGFYDQSHFTRAFKKYTGLTPLAYRRQAWQI